MESDLSTKNLVGRVERDPWKAVLGSRPDTYQIDAVGVSLIGSVDRALFERKIRDALIAGVIMEKWAEHNLHFKAQAPAVMASVYAVCGLYAEAETTILQAKKRVNPTCKDCKAQYLKRLGTFYFHQQTHRQAIRAYTESANLFLAIDKPAEAAVSVLNRGASKYLLEDYDEALADEEYALVLLGEAFNIYSIMCLINIVAVLVAQEKLTLALRKIDEVQERLVGEHEIERPKLIVRWIRALLFEAEGKSKSAGEMIDRIETRMRKLDMKPEMKVLISDRARIAKKRKTIRTIAEKALDMEEVPRIIRRIEAVIAEPSRENLAAWREALTSYVPPFPATI